MQRYYIYLISPNFSLFFFNKNQHLYYVIRTKKSHNNSKVIDKQATIKMDNPKEQILKALLFFVENSPKGLPHTINLPLDSNILHHNGTDRHLHQAAYNRTYTTGLRIRNARQRGVHLRQVSIILRDVGFFICDVRR